MQDINISLNKVRKLMKKMKLTPKARKKFKVTTRQSKQPYDIAPNRLQQNFTVTAPNKARVTDITYVPTNEGWLYVATVLDLFSRKVVGLAMSQRIKTDIVLRATLQAIKHRKPDHGLILHSDRGCQYTSKAYAKLAKQHGIKLSMSRRANCLDNAVMERFFRSLKTERLNQMSFTNHDAAVIEAQKYIYFYNYKRRHSAIGYLTPHQKACELRKVA